MKKLIIAAALAMIALPSYASSLPDAEIAQKFSVSTGPSLAVDFKVSPRASLGASVGSPLYRGFFASGLYDVRFLYKFVNEGKFAVSGLIGAAGNPGFNNGYGYPIGVEAGVAMSFKFTPEFTGRLNLVGSVPFAGSANYDFFRFVAPSSGIEIGYRFNRTFELTLGGNGQGDVLGLNVHF
ncbi:MAG: hypothetical protein H7263_05810 [Candidatus Sericytochromatia bacterium]|nr:hypothetical protein [Candidatus Sericytochromatia bacterium]